MVRSNYAILDAITVNKDTVHHAKWDMYMTVIHIHVKNVPKDVLFVMSITSIHVLLVSMEHIFQVLAVLLVILHVQNVMELLLVV